MRAAPFIVIFDEVGYYCVEGMAIMAAQARSLGFSLVFATQDIPAMLRENDKEAKSIIANTSTKIFMRVEEAEMTAKLAIDSAGKGYRTQIDRFQGSSGETHVAYNDTLEAKVEQIDRISPIDLRALGPGQCFITWMDKYFKVKTFHAFPEGEYEKIGKLELRANHFLPVKKPHPDDVARRETLPRIAERLADPRFETKTEKEAKGARDTVVAAAKAGRLPGPPHSEIPLAATVFLRARGAGLGPVEASAAAIAAILEASRGNAMEFRAAVERQERAPAGTTPAIRSGLRRVAARPPSRMHPVGHGITVNTDMVRMAERIQSNEATLRMLAALDFESERGIETIDGLLEEATSDPAAPGPATAREPAVMADIERADAASAKALHWPRPVNVAQLEGSARSGDAASTASAFLADLLEDAR